MNRLMLLWGALASHPLGKPGIEIEPFIGPIVAGHGRDFPGMLTAPLP